MKEIELKLISELMKNSRRSDRELAKAVGSSQPTVSRTIKRLEKEGYIKEYTIMPDFKKLGYQIMGITLISRSEPKSQEKLAEIRKATTELEKISPHASLVAVSGVGLRKDTLFVTFYKSYSAYLEAMQLVKGIPNIDVQSLESFLVDLNDESHYRILSMSPTAHHLLLKKEKGSFKPNGNQTN